MSNTRRVAGSVRGRRAHNALIALQIALTLVLLAGAGSAMKGFLRMMHTPLGYDPHHVMSVGIPLHENSYTTWAARGAYFEQLRAKVAETPGVTMAAISSNATPPRNGWDLRSLRFWESPRRNSRRRRSIWSSPGYFAALRIPLLEGRVWNEAENHNGAHVAVINRTLAQRYFPNGDAIGHSVKLPGFGDRPPVVLSAAEDRGLVAADRGHRGGCPERRAGEPDHAGGLRAVHAEHVDGNADSGEDRGAAADAAARGAAQLTAVDPEQQSYSNVEDLESWISNRAGVAAGAPGGMDFRCIRRPGPGSGGGRTVQRSLLHGGAADQRVWDSYGAGRAARPRAADRLRVDFGECGERDWARFGAHAGSEYDSRAVGERQLARSGHSAGGCAAAESGVGDCLRDTGVARLQGRSDDGFAVRLNFPTVVVRAGFAFNAEARRTRRKTQRRQEQDRREKRVGCCKWQ